MGAGIVPLLSVMLCLLTAHHPVAAQTREGSASPTNGGVYRRPLRYDPITLDPARITDIYGRSVAQQLFDGLVQYDHTLTVVPALARFWRASRDGLTWTFELRRGVRFHHGREVTADDVVYSLTRLLDPAVKSGAADAFSVIRGAQEFREKRSRQVAGLTALDRYTVQVSLAESLAPFAYLLAVGHAKIVPRDVAERSLEGFGVHPIGTGPFRFLRWERGKEIELAANEDYFEGRPRVSRLVFRIFPGERFDTVYDEFSAGRLEDAPLPTRNYREIVKHPGHVYVKRLLFTLRFYGFNTRVKPLQDPRVRQAVLYAIDREGIVEDLYLGRFVYARGILPPGTPGFDPRLKGFPYRPERARELLAQAGYPGGAGLPRLEIWSSVNDERTVREHRQIRKSLEAVGIPAEFRYQTEWAQFSRALAEGRYPVFLYAWYADTPDPENFLSRLFHSQSPRNLFGYRNGAVDELLVRARTESDAQRRAGLYRRAEQLVLDDAPIAPVWHYTYERLFQPYVRDVEVNGLGDPYIPFRKVWLDRR